MAENAHNSPNDIGSEYWYHLAQKHWLKPSDKARKVKTDVVKHEIWDVLERDHFAHTSLVTLEGLQLLERHVVLTQSLLKGSTDNVKSYLWPSYDHDSINPHVLLIAILVTVKARERFPAWDVFANDQGRFSSFFRRALAMSLDMSLSINVRTFLLCFLVKAFQSLDNGIVRKECAPLVSISIWHNLASDSSRERRFEENGHLKKVWRASAKRYEAADEAGKARLRFERSWLYTLVVDFTYRLYRPQSGKWVLHKNFLHADPIGS